MDSDDDSVSEISESGSDTLTEDEVDETDQDDEIFNNSKEYDEISNNSKEYDEISNDSFSGEFSTSLKMMIFPTILDYKNIMRFPTILKNMMKFPMILSATRSLSPKCRGSNWNSSSLDPGDDPTGRT
uniref:Uncharacterized protein n=1 Tax=Cacopsylla melanoneura TaxID=428564 RepID=A0A8D9AQZ4_9HEMI